MLNNCRLILADTDGDVIAERNMAKKGNWKMAPVPVKLDSTFTTTFKATDAHIIAEKVCKNNVSTNFVAGNFYVFSLPVGFLNWRLIGIIPMNYSDPSDVSIIRSLEGIMHKAKYDLLMAEISVGLLVILGLMLFLAISKNTIRNRLMPLLHQFVELSRTLISQQNFRSKDIQDVDGLSSEYDDIKTAIISYEKIIEEQSRFNAISETAAQVAHDIRSPLAALDMAVKNTAHVPEEQRVVIRNASNRIRDIANNLIEKYRRPGDAGKHSGAAPFETGSVYLFSALLDPLLTEKRLQFQSRPGIQIDIKLPPESYGLFAKLQPVELRRMISNLVNNAVEALGDNGAVSVGLTYENGGVILTVADNGKGIPPEILAKLGQKGETHGKAGGSGLGLYHARTTAESWGGSLDISSEIGKGTTVTVKLPKAEPPDWFVPKLEFAAGKAVVVLDDDITIHQVWKGRFESSRIRERGIETFSFSGAEQLRDWVKSNPAKAEGAVYLLDYELVGHKETGLSIAEELDISRQAVLVTSRWEEPQILSECKRLGIRLLPKGLSGIVPISVTGAEPQTSVAALIDDDPLVHMTWKMAARQKGVSFRAFKSVDAFLSADVPKETTIYVDSELGNGVKGEEVSKTLFADGYKTIILATGHAPDSFPPMAWIKKIVGKEPPWQ